MQTRYNIFFTRQKISLMAFMNEMSVSELIQFTILKIYGNRKKDGLVEPKQNQTQKTMRQYKNKALHDIFSGERQNTFEIIMDLNSEYLDPEERDLIKLKIK